MSRSPVVIQHAKLIEIKSQLVGSVSVAEAGAVTVTRGIHPESGDVVLVENFMDSNRSVMLRV